MEHAFVHAVVHVRSSRVKLMFLTFYILLTVFLGSVEMLVRHGHGGGVLLSPQSWWVPWYRGKIRESSLRTERSDATNGAPGLTTNGTRFATRSEGHRF